MSRATTSDPSLTHEVPESLAVARTGLPIRRRLLVLGSLSAVGGATFLPFLAAGTHQPVSALSGFVVIVTVVATLAAWPGLRCADAVGLPMPYLRVLDAGATSPVPNRALTTTFALGVGLGLLGLALLRLANAPALPGTPAVRALSALFAAGPLEVVLHLGVMSVVVWLTRGRRWSGIIAAALALVAFHVSDTAGQPHLLVAASVLGNSAIGLGLGYVYAAYGLEYAMFGHAIAHLITVVLG